MTLKNLINEELSAFDEECVIYPYDADGLEKWKVEPETMRQFLSQSLSRVARKVLEESNLGEKELMRQSEGADKIIFLKGGIPIPRGNNVDDTMYNLGVIHSVKSQHSKINSILE